MSQPEAEDLQRVGEPILTVPLEVGASRNCHYDRPSDLKHDAKDLLCEEHLSCSAGHELIKIVHHVVRDRHRLQLGRRGMYLDLDVDSISILSV